MKTQKMTVELEHDDIRLILGALWEMYSEYIGPNTEEYYKLYKQFGGTLPEKKKEAFK